LGTSINPSPLILMRISLAEVGENEFPLLEANRANLEVAFTAVLEVNPYLIDLGRLSLAICVGFIL